MQIFYHAPAGYFEANCKSDFKRFLTSTLPWASLALRIASVKPVVPVSVTTTTNQGVLLRTTKRPLSSDINPICSYLCPGGYLAECLVSPLQFLESVESFPVVPMPCLLLNLWPLCQQLSCSPVLLASQVVALLEKTQFIWTNSCLCWFVHATMTIDDPNMMWGTLCNFPTVTLSRSENFLDFCQVHIWRKSEKPPALQKTDSKNVDKLFKLTQFKRRGCTPEDSKQNDRQK